MILYARGGEEERTCNGNPTVSASKESALSTRPMRVKEMMEEEERQQEVRPAL